MSLIMNKYAKVQDEVEVEKLRKNKIGRCKRKKAASAKLN